MDATVQSLITLLNNALFADIAADIATLESQSPVYDPAGDINAAITLVEDLRTLSARAVEIANMMVRISAVKNVKEALPSTMRDAA